MRLTLIDMYALAEREFARNTGRYSGMIRMILLVRSTGVYILEYNER